MTADIHEFPKAGQVGGYRRGAGGAEAPSVASTREERLLALGGVVAALRAGEHLEHEMLSLACLVFVDARGPESGAHVLRVMAESITSTDGPEAA